MKILGIIPARYASTRFPGKPLFVIGGKSMIQRVYEQSSRCTSLDRVIVATDHELIEKHVAFFGGNVIMTGSHHQSGTERCAEVLSKLAGRNETYDAVVNIQGDEPYIDPRQIDQVVRCFDREEVLIATLAKKILLETELNDPNVVKVIFGINNQAIYFSRSVIPFTQGKEKPDWIHASDYYKHIGIYGYRTNILQALVRLRTSPLEKAESLEQLRWLENGFPVYVQETVYESIAIDTPSDLLKITNIS